jgi:hypothetical protein
MYYSQRVIAKQGKKKKKKKKARKGKKRQSGGEKGKKEKKRKNTHSLTSLHSVANDADMTVNCWFWQLALFLSPLSLSLSSYEKKNNVQKSRYFRWKTVSSCSYSSVDFFSSGAEEDSDICVCVCVCV